MLDLDSLTSGLDVAALVPQVYAEFRPLVAEALAFFLKHLSPRRLSAILLDQASLPPDAELSTRVVRFMHACPALHKLGQVIARHRELDAGFRRRLQRLETMEPSAYMDQVLPVVRRDLGESIDRYQITLGTPLAEASVAVVLPVTWTPTEGSPGSRPARQDAVVKVLKPGVQDELHEDLEILAKLADHFDRQRSRWSATSPGLRNFEYRSTFDEVRQLLTHEINFAQEQANLSAAARQYAGRRDVQIPRPLPFCTGHVTAMQRVYGRRVTDLCGVCPLQGRRLAEAVVGALIGDVIFSREPAVMFHADPHAGNLFATQDGRLAILDWSLTGKLRRDHRTQIVQILVGGLALDEARIKRAIAALTAATPNRAALDHRVTEALQQVGQGRFPGISWLMRLLDRLARDGVRFGSDLLLFRKTYFTLEGVVQDICGRGTRSDLDCSVESILLRLAAAQLASEWPARFVRPPGSRDFATHLSTADLLHVATLAPLNLAGIWARSWHNLLEPLYAAMCGRPAAISADA